MLAKTYTAAINGLEANTITVEVNMTRGVMFRLSGLADTSVKESYDRIKAAIQNNGFKMPVADLMLPEEVQHLPGPELLVPVDFREA